MSTSMASSRIFVRGLPPQFSEHEFREHFGAQQRITDAKLFPHRRIGYVGFKTPGEAEHAVKYFNKSFIRMSRIGVEIARPYHRQSTQESGTNNEPRTVPQSNGASAGHEVRDAPRQQSPENTLKRKRGSQDVAVEDPKLKEFLEVMLPPKKSKGLTQTDATDAFATQQTGEVDDERSDSDEDYQTIASRSQQKPPTESSRPDSTEAQQPDESGNNEDAPVSDADWLRSRTRVMRDPNEDNEATEQTHHLQAEEILERNGAAEPNGSTSDAVGAEAVQQDDPGGPDEDVRPVSGDVGTIQSTGRLFVRNLSYSIDENTLRETFSSYGRVQEVHVPIDSTSGSPKGFAYVQFVDPEDATKATEALDGSIFQGRLMHILPAAAKRQSGLDEYAISKLPLKKQKQIRRKAEAASSTFNWNSLYMNADSVMSSIADRLGVNKSDLLDPTASDAAVKQAQAETHVIQEMKSYFAEHGVDLEAFKSRQRGDTAILVKNFPYGTTVDELRKMFEEHGEVKRLLMPPSGTIAIIEFREAPQARAAFGALAYRKLKDTLLFLEKAPRDLLIKQPSASAAAPASKVDDGVAAKVSTSDLWQAQEMAEAVDTTTLFIRNLNFSTTTQRLTEVFKPLAGLMSARVKTKPNPKKTGETLSMGFGFLEFRTKEQAQAALSAMDGYNLDGHRLQIKASHKGMDAAEERRKEDRAKKAASRKTKIVIKNLPFEATKKDVRALFGSYGQLRSVRVPKKFDSSARGFAFADFTTPREAENALGALRNTHFLGRRLVLDFAAEDPADAEEEIEKMQRKVESQVNKVAIQRLTGAGRKKFNVAGNDDVDDV